MGGAPRMPCTNCQYLPPPNQEDPPNAIVQLANTERFQIMRQGQIVANPAQTRG